MADIANLHDVLEIVSDKESEIKTVISNKISEFLQELQAKNDHILALNDQLSSLKSDFSYNVELIHQRDSEINELEQRIKVLESRLNMLEEEKSDLLVTIDKLRQDVGDSVTTRNRITLDLNGKIRDMIRDMEHLKRNHSIELAHERQKNEKLDQSVACKIQEVEQKHQIEMKQMLISCQETLETEIDDYRTKNNNLQRTNMEQSLQIQLLHEELKILRKKNQDLIHQRKRSDVIIQDSKQHIADEQFQCKKIVAQLEFDNDQLKKQNLDLLAELTSLQSTHDKKLSQLEAELQEKRCMIDSLRESMRTEKHNFGVQLAGLSQANADLKSEHQLMVDRLEKDIKMRGDELFELREQIGSLLGSINSLQKEKDSLLADKVRAQNVVEAKLFENEVQLQNARLQLRKYESLLSELAITSSPTKVTTAVHAVDVVKSDHTQPTPTNPEIASLKAENFKLKNIIRQMTDELESIQAMPHQTQDDEYVSALQQEIGELKAKLRSLNDRMPLVDTNVCYKASETQNERLKTCYAYIKVLMKEKSQLMELSNRLHNKLLDLESSGARADTANNFEKLENAQYHKDKVQILAGMHAGVHTAGADAANIPSGLSTSRSGVIVDEAHRKKPAETSSPRLDQAAESREQVSSSVLFSSLGDDDQSLNAVWQALDAANAEQTLLSDTSSASLRIRGRPVGLLNKPTKAAHVK